MTEALTAPAPSDTAAHPARPQPLGAFPLPAGYLLVPPGEDTDAARIELLAGCLPDPWPARMRAHELAMADDRDAALAELTGDDVVTRYNRLVLDTDSLQTSGPEIARLRADLGELAPLVDVVLYVLGHSETPPELGSADGEIAALVLSAQAAHALSAEDPAGAVALLDRAADTARPVSPPLAGLMLGAAASIFRDSLPGEPDVAAGMRVSDTVARLEKALKDLKAAEDLRLGRAELHLSLAGILHELAQTQPHRMAQAIPNYHSTLQLVLSHEAPELWAAAHANLAAAYLTMPMTEASDQLRLGVAVQSLRSALKVYTPETHPERWASTQLNLANSLVYTPSKHQADNLVEAVELYEAVLEMRTRQDDPIGRARVLSNQGNTLAHLGMFDHAKAKLYEARFIFEEFGDDDSVRAVRGVLDEVARELALAKNPE